MDEIFNIQDLHQWIDKISCEKVFIVGAGDYGEYIGEYITKRGVSWEGYIDKRGHGKLNNKSIFGYDTVVTDAFYIASSVVFGSTMVSELVDRGVSKDRIAVVKQRSLFTYICSEMNIESHGYYYVSSGGEMNLDITFMVMERAQPYEGIFADFLYYLKACEYAKKKGMVPVVDDTYFIRCCYQNADKYCKENAWEYYFEQPGGYSLKEVNNSKNIRHYNLDDSQNLKIMFYVDNLDNMTEKEHKYWNRMINKYMVLKPDLKERVDSTYIALFSKCRGKKVLGVSVREGYMIGANNNLTHNSIRVQPTTEVFIDYVKKKLRENMCEFVFLICQTTDAVEMFRKEFGDLLIVTERARNSFEELKVLEGAFSYGIDMEFDKIERTKEYIVDIYLLSKCDSLLCGWTHGNMVTYLLKEGEFDSLDVFDSGMSNW